MTLSQLRRVKTPEIQSQRTAEKTAETLAATSAKMNISQERKKIDEK